jgi:hypothetical protein
MICVWSKDVLVSVCHVAVQLWDVKVWNLSWNMYLCQKRSHCWFSNMSCPLTLTLPPSKWLSLSLSPSLSHSLPLKVALTLKVTLTLPLSKWLSPSLSQSDSHLQSDSHHPPSKKVTLTDPQNDFHHPSFTVTPTLKVTLPFPFPLSKWLSISQSLQHSISQIWWKSIKKPKNNSWIILKSS